MQSVIKLVSVVVLTFLSQTVNAGAWQDFSKSFQLFLKKVNDSHEMKRKEYATDQLTRFHSDLFAIERHHQYLILMIENPGMIDNNLSYSLYQLRKKAGSANKKLKKIGKKSATFSSDLKRMRKQLYLSANSKKNWPSNIKKVEIPDYHLEHYLLTEGKSAFQVTREARKALETFLKNH